MPSGTMTMILTACAIALRRAERNIDRADTQIVSENPLDLAPRYRSKTLNYLLYDFRH